MLMRGPHAPLAIDPVSVADFVLHHAVVDPAKPAVIDGSTQRVVSYEELREEVRRSAAGLLRAGVSRGDVVGLFGPTSPEYITAFYALTSIGAVVTSLNVIHNVAELAYQLADSGAAAVLLTCEPTAALKRAVEKVRVPRTLRLDEVRTGVTAAHMDAGLSIEASHVASITYTDAASAVPMGVMVTHGNLIANVQQTQAVEAVSSSDVLVGLMPFCQLYGMVAANLGLLAGATVVTFPHFSLDWLLGAIDRYRVTMAYLVPPAIRTLAKHGRVRDFDVSSLKKITALTAPLPESVARACSDRLGCNVRQAYGLTEAVAVTHFAPRTSSKLASVGMPVPNTECRVVDVMTRCDVGPGELGEVWVRGPQVTKGYHNNAEITADIIDPQGWLRTCDIGYTDDDGCLFVVDRSKKLARLRGLHRQDGELLRAAVEDIAARLKASDKVRVQSVLLNSVRESVVSTDTSNKVTFWNKGAESLFGYRAEEALGQRVESLILPDGVECLERERGPALRTCGTWNAQVRRRRKDGSIIWTDVVVSSVSDAGGELSGFVGIHRDITEHRKAEERLRFQAQLLDSVLESVVATDLSGNITFWARGAEALFGYDASETLGRSLAPLTFPSEEDPDAALRAVRDAVFSEGSWTGRAVPCRRNGSDFWADVTFAPVLGADGRRVGLIAVHRDVTELRRNQELVRESHERTRSLATRLMVIREHERSSIARELHDELGQALTRLSIDVAWLTNRLPERLRTKRARGMGPLVDQTISAIQQISSQLRPPVLDDLGLEAAIEWQVHEFEEWSGCRCELELAIGGLSRDKDRDIAIFRILQEALTNVARHARAERVKVLAKRAGDEFVMSIEDDGIGIAPWKVTDRQSFGLAGMAERVEGLGGDLRISRSSSGRGTLVSLRLRITEQAVQTFQYDSVAHR